MSLNLQNFEKWAKVYDIIYANYVEDLDFYKNEALRVKDKVLEIGCGTGRVYLELLREGIDVYGIDVSQSMLRALTEKAKKLGLTSKVVRADMRNFRFNAKFSLIIIPFRAFLHNLTLNDQVKTLKNCREHLKLGGRLILNFFFPNPEKIVKNYGVEKQDKIIDLDGEKYVLTSKSYFIDEVNQIVESIQTLRSENGKVLWRGKIQIAFIYKREFELLLRLAGFKKWHVYGGYNYEPLESYKQEMVWIVEN